MKPFRFNIIFLILILTHTLYMSEVSAASFSVSPVVIDEKAYARDIIRGSVKLSSNGQKKPNVYVFVNNLNTQTGEVEFIDPSRADMSVSLANWISISRAVIEIPKGEEKTIDFEIKINPRASSGMYHAIISFGEGSTRDSAENKLLNAPSVTINVEVLDDARERLQLLRFIPDRNFFSGFPVSFSYDIENIGNRDLVPSGNIRVYNRRGEEVAVIVANTDGESIAPDVTTQLASVLSSAKGFGRFKAMLDVEYGTKERGTIQDTVFFWVVPWIPIAASLGFFIIIAIFLGVTVHKRFEKHTRHRVSHVFKESHKVVDLRRPKN